MFKIEDKGKVVDFFWYDKLIAKLDRSATIDGVPDQFELHINIPSKMPQLYDSLIGNDFYRMEIKSAKLTFHGRICYRSVKKCDHIDCLCFMCWAGFESPEKCSTCDYRDCCDK